MDELAVADRSGLGVGVLGVFGPVVEVVRVSFLEVVSVEAVAFAVAPLLPVGL